METCMVHILRCSLAMWICMYTSGQLFSFAHIRWKMYMVPFLFFNCKHMQAETCRSTCQCSWLQRLDTSTLCLLWEQLRACTAATRGRSRPKCKVFFYSTCVAKYKFHRYYYSACTCTKVLSNWFCPSVRLSICQWEIFESEYRQGYYPTRTCAKGLSNCFCLSVSLFVTLHVHGRKG